MVSKRFKWLHACTVVFAGNVLSSSKSVGSLYIEICSLLEKLLSSTTKLVLRQYINTCHSL